MDTYRYNSDGSYHNDVRQKVAEGLLYAHSRINGNTSRTLEASAFLYALVELLQEKGLLTVEELDQRKEAVGKRLAQQFLQKGMGVKLQDPEYDKYEFTGTAMIDCESRVHLCKASCCRLPFALSKQDVQEGVVRWDLGRPYIIEQGEDGYCSHFDRHGQGCTIYQQRPVPCRGYDCREDKRIWLDFEKRVPNPAIGQPGWPYSLAEQEQEASTDD